MPAAALPSPGPVQSRGGHLGGFTLPRPRLPFASSSRPFPPRRCRSSEKQPLSIPKRLKCPAGGCAQPPAKCPSLHSSLSTAASRGPLPSRVPPGRDGLDRVRTADHPLAAPGDAPLRLPGPRSQGPWPRGESGAAAWPCLPCPLPWLPSPRGAGSRAVVLWARGDAPEERIWGRGGKGGAGGF